MKSGENTAYKTNTAQSAHSARGVQEKSRSRGTQGFAHQTYQTHSLPARSEVLKQFR